MNIYNSLLQRAAKNAYWDGQTRPSYAANSVEDFNRMMASYNCGKGLPKFDKGDGNASNAWRFWYESLNKKQKGWLNQQIDFFRKNGFDDTSIAGILGNSFVESSFNPDAYSDTKAYHGWYQMSKDMEKAVRKTYGNFSPESQMMFLNDMFSGNKDTIGSDWVDYGKKYKKNSYKDAASSAEAFRKEFERNLKGYDPKRIKYANYAQDYMREMYPYVSPEDVALPMVNNPAIDEIQQTQNLNMAGRQDNTRVVIPPSNFTKSMKPGYIKKKAIANRYIQDVFVNPMEQAVKELENQPNIWSGNLVGYNKGKSYPFNFWNRNPYTLKPVIR